MNMGTPSILTIAANDDGVRLDRWLRRNFPGLTQGRIEQMLRKGQIRVDERKVAANFRISAGQAVRVPTLPAEPAKASQAAPRKRPIPPGVAEDVKDRILYRDDWLIVLDKPAGLAVQGGTGTWVHIDAILDELKFEASERPRLVHRLDRDTSGILILARHAESARRLTKSFSGRTVKKLYWAITVGVPTPLQGRIDLKLAKRGGKGQEKMAVASDGQRAITYYDVVDHAGKKAALLAMLPITGRTHQLRVHAAAIGTPLLGDGKYGGEGAYLTEDAPLRKLHLHAGAIQLPHPATGKPLVLTAPLPKNFRDSLKFLGLEQPRVKNPFTLFAEIDE